MVVDCPNCGKENKNTNIRCEFCSTQLINTNEYDQYSNLVLNGNNLESKEINVSTKKVGCLTNILMLIFAGPWLLVGIVFFGVGLFSSISEYNQTKGYEKTIGILKDYGECTYDDGNELCEAIYEYQVNGVIYTVSPNLLSNSDGFDESDTVYYNPNNPSESLMYSSWSNLTIVGLIFIIVVSVILVFINRKIKKISKGKDNITMKVYKTA